MAQTTTTTTNATNAPTSGATSDPQEYQKLVQRVADKVWVLWRQEMRRESERRRK